MHKILFILPRFFTEEIFMCMWIWYLFLYLQNCWRVASPGSKNLCSDAIEVERKKKIWQQKQIRNALHIWIGQNRNKEAFWKTTNGKNSSKNSPSHGSCPNLLPSPLISSFMLGWTRNFKRWCAGKLALWNNELWFVVFANFYGVNTPRMADFKLIAVTEHGVGKTGTELALENQ